MKGQGTMTIHMWNNLSREEIGALAQEATVVLPIGATEQHGPHLPVITDNVLIEAVASKSVEKASGIPIVLAPVIPFGFSHHHLIFPGALSLSTDTLLRALKDLTECLVKSGFKKIFILNGHGGNDECIRIAVRNIALDYPVTAGAASYWTIAWEAMVQYAERNGMLDLPGHAGQFETSMMLALRPDLVHLERLAEVDRTHVSAGSYKGLLEKPHIEKHSAWADMNGFSDNPLTAKAEFGEQLLEIITDEVAEQFVHFHKYA
jgi:creatinine amidohydrolase